MPYCGEHQADDNDPFGESGGGEELTDREQIRDGGQSEPENVRRFTSVVKFE